MIKPILKIELPEWTEVKQMDEVSANLKESTAAQDYHIIVITGKSDFMSIEIITAADASIHKP